MIELDEKDIKVIATNRFLRPRQKKLSISLIGLLVSMSIFMYLGLNYLVFLSYAGFIYCVIWVFRGTGKAKKALVKEWKGEKE